MPLLYANLCKVCHQHRTQNPSGICSRCQRLKGEKYCKICGTVKTTNSSGICHRCTKRGFAEDDGKARLEQAIADTKLTLFILERRRDGNSFTEIAKSCNLSRSGCYLRYMQACGNRRILDAAVDAVDQTVVENTSEEDE